jgi:hypothetical protein
MKEKEKGGMKEKEKGGMKEKGRKKKGREWRI